MRTADYLLLYMIMLLFTLVIETLREQVERQPNEVLHLAFSEWLKAEIENSRFNQNAILNEYDGTFQASTLYPYGDSRNVQANKAKAHFSRLEGWTDELFTHEDSDEVIAKQLFCVLMGISGAFREQCFVIASNQTSYMTYRYGGLDLGMNINQRVDSRLCTLFGKLPSTDDLRQPVISKQQLIESTHEVNRQRNDVARHQYQGKKPLNLQKPFLAVRWLRLREAWLELATDYAVYTAQLHDGDLTKVPFLEPKTIASAALVYPLAEAPPTSALSRK